MEDSVWSPGNFIPAPVVDSNSVWNVLTFAPLPGTFTYNGVALFNAIQTYDASLNV